MNKFACLVLAVILEWECVWGTCLFKLIIILTPFDLHKKILVWNGSGNQWLLENILVNLLIMMTSSELFISLSVWVTLILF